MKKILTLIIVLISVTFLNACGNKESSAADPSESNTVDLGNADTKPTDTTTVDTNTESVAPDGSQVIKRPKLPKIPSGQVVDNSVNNVAVDDTANNDKKIEEDVKSILSDITKEENLNNDTGSATTEATDTTK